MDKESVCRHCRQPEPCRNGAQCYTAPLPVGGPTELIKGRYMKHPPKGWPKG